MFFIHVSLEKYKILNKHLVGYGICIGSLLAAILLFFSLTDIHIYDIAKLLL